MASVAHLKGPKVNGVRENIYYATHVDYVEGLEERIKCYDKLGNNSDRSITQKAITEEINSINDSIQKLSDHVPHTDGNTNIIISKTEPADNVYWLLIEGGLDNV